MSHLSIIIKHAVFICEMITCSQRLHDGVLRDLERVERKRENLRVLEEQIQLTRELVAARDRQEADTPGTHSS